MKEIYKIPKGQNVSTEKGVKYIDNEIKTFFYEVEQVPENWEELKELCKGLKEEDILVSNDCIVFRDLNFYKSGIICVPDSEYFSISTNRTPAQMWQIIKSLIGEE